MRSSQYVNLAAAVLLPCWCLVLRDDSCSSSILRTADLDALTSRTSRHGREASLSLVSGLGVTESPWSLVSAQAFKTPIRQGVVCFGVQDQNAG